MPRTPIFHIYVIVRWKSDADYAGNARHYLLKAQEVNKITPTDDTDMMEHIQTLLEELGSGISEPPGSDEINIGNIEADKVADMLDEEAQANEIVNDVIMHEEA